MKISKEYQPLVTAASAVVFVNMVLPLLDGLCNVGISAMNRVINSWKIQMELDTREGEAAAEVIAPTGSVSHAIGFTIPSEEDYDYDEDDDED